MPSAAVFAVQFDPVRNLLRARFAGRISAGHLQAGLLEAGERLKAARTGFTVLTDLSALEAMDLDCGPLLGKIMDLCKAHGVQRVIRVVPDPHKDIGLNILSLIHYQGKVQLITCETLVEAERELG